MPDMEESMNPEDKDAPMAAIKYQYSPKGRTFLNERAVRGALFFVRGEGAGGEFFVTL